MNPLWGDEKDSETTHAPRGRELDEGLSPDSQSPGPEDPRAEPTPAERLDIWKRLRFLFKPRPLRA